VGEPAVGLSAEATGRSRGWPEVVTFGLLSWCAGDKSAPELAGEFRLALQALILNREPRSSHGQATAASFAKTRSHAQASRSSTRLRIFLSTSIDQAAVDNDVGQLLQQWGNNLEIKLERRCAQRRRREPQIQVQGLVEHAYGQQRRREPPCQRCLAVASSAADHAGHHSHAKTHRRHPRYSPGKPLLPAASIAAVTS